MLTACAGAGHTPGAAPAHAPATAPRPSATQAPAPATTPVGPPRDLAAMTQRPCDLLTASQATGFQLDLPADQLTGLHGTLRCMWTTTTSPAHNIVRMLDVSLSVNSPAFDAAYNRDRGLPVFDVITIAGYPALVTMVNVKLPICTVRIKVADQQSVSVDYEDRTLNKNPQQSCDIDKRVAAAVLTNVPLKS
ncbi:MAG TPA: DUF3558 domain-containing protein [Pseudonocardiaceae bacterium]|nr:DUF3558 domain-containing protein [Pseudonocardiaceae bacterium]